VIAARTDVTAIVTRTADVIARASRVAALAVSRVVTEALHSRRVMRLVTRLVMRRAKPSGTNRRVSAIRNVTPSARHNVSGSANGSASNRRPPTRTPLRSQLSRLATATWPFPVMFRPPSRQVMERRRTDLAVTAVAGADVDADAAAVVAIAMDSRIMLVAIRSRAAISLARAKPPMKSASFTHR